MFASGLDLTMVGLDVTHQALMTPAHAERLGRADGRASSSPTCTRSTRGSTRSRYGWDGAPVHDAVALAHVIDATLLGTRHCGVVVDTGPELSRGRTYVDLRGAHWEPNCHVAVEIDSDRFLELLVERIARSDRGPQGATNVPTYGSPR